MPWLLCFFLMLFTQCDAPVPASLLARTPLSGRAVSTTIHPATISAIPLPAGYHRLSQSESSFGTWLRKLSLKPDKTVYLFNGQPKRNQSAQYAVVDISIGAKDLQQCADAVMRLKAEYLYDQKEYDKIGFHATDGTFMDYESWRKGYRFRLQGNGLTKVLTAAPSLKRSSFSQYLETVFSFAGTLSLQKELHRLPDPHTILPGDVFIQGGSLGHAVIVADVAQNEMGEKIFLLAQSYMPAQNIHILVNPADQSLSPWYKMDESASLVTPEWDFKAGALSRFP